VVWSKTKVLAINAVCLSKCIAIDWSKTKLLRLSLVSDQTLVLDFGLSLKFGLRL